MKLLKRYCNIKARIEPLGASLLAVSFDFETGKFEFTPSSAVGSQFGDFICALYTLYHEESNGRYEGHSEWHNREYHTNDSHRIQAITVTVEWDGEGPYMILKMTKKVDSDTIQIRVSTDFEKTYTDYTVNGCDFCYAITKAYTEALKKFGFYGFRYSTEGEPVMIHQLLFLKAYALGNMDARELTLIDEGLDCCKTNFDKEMELLLFDM